MGVDYGTTKRFGSRTRLRSRKVDGRNLDARQSMVCALEGTWVHPPGSSLTGVKEAFGDRKLSKD